MPEEYKRQQIDFMMRGYGKGGGEMPCKDEVERIRAKDVGRPGHHYVQFAVTKKKGPRGGKTKQIGSLKAYKGDGRGWPGESDRHADAAELGHARKGTLKDHRKKKRKFSRQELTAMTYAKSPEDREFEKREQEKRDRERKTLHFVKF